MNYLFKESVKILTGSNTDFKSVGTILEDVNSPVTRKFQEKLYKDVLEKKHVDFGDIPKSRGDITSYSGYSNMMDTLDTLRQLANENNASGVIKYIDIISKAVSNIQALTNIFKKGFSTRTEYVALEYNSYVYLCVEATTALIYSFVDYVKNPTTRALELKIVDNKLRADAFFFNQLDKFNNIQAKMRNDYIAMLDNMCSGDKDSFIGTSTLVGIGAVIGMAVISIPITREVIYQIFNIRTKLSDYLELQSNFLEMNRARVENNDIIMPAKKKEILAKQEKLSKKLKSLSDKLKLKSAVSVKEKDNALNKKNKMLSVDNLKDEVKNSDFEIF